MPVPANLDAPTIQCENLSRWFGQIIALSNVNLTIGRGIVGVLGPNGAGKTTLLELLMGRLRPSRGTVRVFGVNPWSTPAVFRHVGYCPDSDGVYDLMSALEFVSLMASLTGFSSGESKKRATQRLEMLGLGPHAQKPLGTFSKGMRQRARLAAALVHDPSLLVLDEPFNGLDPLARIEQSRVLRQLGAQGLTILVSSHILAEVEAMTSRIILIHHGNILAEGEISEIRALIDNQPYTYRVECDQPRQVAKQLVELASVESISFDSDTSALIFRTLDAPGVCATLQNLAAQGRVRIHSLAPLDESLEAVFQYLIKE